MDIGAGTGRFSLYLQDRGHTVAPLDVVDKSVTGLDIETFNGYSIDSTDNSFDTSILMFVLHHTNTQVELLKEASRVSRNYIIIAEDIVETSWDKMVGNIHLNTSPWARGDDSFRTKQGWLDLFEELNLEVIEVNDIPVDVYPVYPVNRAVFVLKPPT